MRHVGIGRAVTLMVVAVCFAPRGSAAEPARNSSTLKPSAVIEGTVTYKPDSKRPWRYARYYVKRRKTGRLAEAVIALVPPKSAKIPASAKQTTHVVDQKNFNFIPETLVIRAGDQVTFKNSDAAVHNVRAFDPTNEFNINMPAGGDYTRTFAATGGIGRPVRIGCVFHSAMRAWVYVFSHPFYHITKPDGRFRITNIPPGTQTLEVIHPAGQLRFTKTIVVQPEHPLKLDISLSPDNKVKSIRFRRSNRKRQKKHDSEKS